MLLFDGQFKEGDKPEPIGALARTAVWLVLALTVLNVISTLLECGFGACPDNPEVYELLRRGPLGSPSIPTRSCPAASTSRHRPRG
jgi:hypothetical protein